MKSTGAPSGMIRFAVVLPLILIVAPALAAGIMATGVSWPVACVIATLACMTAAVWLTPKLPNLTGGSKTLPWLWLGASALATYFVTTQSVFMGDVTRTRYAFNPVMRDLDDEAMAKPFFPRHDCFTSYIVAGYLAQSRVENLYDKSHYRRTEEPTPIHDEIGGKLDVDTYQYPPPFLLLPHALMATKGDFFQLRAYWYAINIALLVAVFVTLMRWLDGTRFHVYWLALPVLLCAPILRGTLQIQNVHLFIVAISLLALPAFDRRKSWLGGALLGFAIVSKLFPGLLLVFLLLQRRWRAVIWTGGWIVIYVVLAFAFFGPKPFEAFIDYQLPRLVNGEAFWFATCAPRAILANSSIWGISYKLGNLGLVSDPQPIAKTIVWVYTAVTVGVLLAVGLRRQGWSVATATPPTPSARRLSLLRVWLALFIVGQLRSPFLPWDYGNVAALLLLFLFLPLDLRVARALLVAGGAALLALTLPLPVGSTGISVDLVYTLAGAVVVLTCVTLALIQRPAAEPVATAGAPG